MMELWRRRPMLLVLLIKMGLFRGDDGLDRVMKYAPRVSKKALVYAHDRGLTKMLTKPIPFMTK